VWPGQRVFMDVTPGTHKVVVRLDWLRSNEFEVVATTEPGSVVDLSCTCNGWLSAPLRSIFMPWRYLDLHLMAVDELARCQASRPPPPAPRNLGHPEAG